MLTTNGPPIRQRMRDLDGGLRIRESYGDTPTGISRFDIHAGRGWQDFAWQDRESGQVWYMRDDKGQPTLAALGKSQWAGNGPAVPAERGCTDCHNKIGRATESDPIFEQIQAELLTQLVALHGPYKDRQKPVAPAPAPAPVPIKVVEGKPGRDGLDGKPGRDGRDGVDGKTPTDGELIALIRRVMEEKKDDLRGDDGKDGKSPTDADLLVLIRRVVDEKQDELKGDQPKIDLDELAKKLPPIYIGAKSPDGKVTMPFTPVYLGQGVYIHVEPPSLPVEKRR